MLVLQTKVSIVKKVFNTPKKYMHHISSPINTRLSTDATDFGFIFRFLALYHPHPTYFNKCKLYFIQKYRGVLLLKHYRTTWMQHSKSKICAYIDSSSMKQRVFPYLSSLIHQMATASWKSFMDWLFYITSATRVIANKNCSGL